MKIKLLTISLFLSCVAGCGGGGDTSSDNASIAPIHDLLPRIASPLLPLAQGISFGKTYWPDGSTKDGGNGKSVGNVGCASSEEFHLHAHLTVLLDGVPLAVPAKIGLQGCNYELHTHDQSGIIHEETSFSHALTLGDFFAIWGQPLQPDNVAGIRGKTVSVFTIQNGVVQRVSSAFSDIPIQAHTEIIICIGEVPASIPSFVWDPLL